LIANAGAMGLDWERLSLSSYMEALEAANEMNDPDAAKKAGSDTDATGRLQKFMSAHAKRDG
jgi:hypothetical protein